MAVARALTRNVGRNQIRELRSSDYPQAGLRESIIPNAVNTSIAGTEVMAIRCNNHFEPTIINSKIYLFNESGGILNLPFLNIKKGTNSQGVTFSNNGNISVQTGNKSVAGALLNNSFKRTNVNQSSITSFTVNPALNSNDYAATYSNNFVDVVQVNGINKSAFFLENRLTGLSGQRVNFNYMDLAKGGVKNVTTQIRNNTVVDFLSFNSINVGITFFVNPYPQTASNININQYRISGVEPLGTLTYSQTNTNQNNNAAWLLRQRTQYQKQFNKLKTLGV